MFETAQALTGPVVENVPNGEYTVHVDRFSQSAWTDIVSNFNDANIYQTYAYGSVRWGLKQLTHLTVETKGEMVAAAQLRIVRVPFLKRGIAFLPWGPLWKRRERPECLRHLKEALVALYEQYAVQRKLLLRIQPADLELGPLYDQICRIFESARYQSVPNHSAYRTLVVDLTASLPELKRNLRSGWRRNLAAALRNRFDVRVGAGPELWWDFLQLYKEMLERKKFVPGVDVREFGRVQEKLEKPMKMQIFVAYLGGRPAAAVVVSCIGERGIFLLGATGKVGLKAKGSYLLHWRVIEWLRRKRAICYDLGGIDPVKNPGVYAFKRGLSGSDVCHIGRYEAAESRISAWICRASFEKILRRTIRYLH